MSSESHGALRVLVADDSEEITGVLEALLKSIEGIEVLQPVHDGFEALQQIRGSRPDVLILDLKMPVLTGCDVLREIRYESVRPAIIVFTNYSEADYGRPCKELGASFFVRKPNFDEVLEQLKQLRHEWLLPQHVDHGHWSLARHGESYPGHSGG